MQLAYLPYLERMNGKSLPPMTIDYAQEIEQYPTWVIELEGRIAGGIILMFEKTQLSIANISVHPEFQGRGLGRKLLAFAETCAREHDYKKMALATHVLLTENIALYNHLGWREHDRDATRVYMSKAVSTATASDI